MKSITDKINEELKKIPDPPISIEVEKELQDIILLSNDKDSMSWDNMSTSSPYNIDDLVLQPLDWANLSPLFNQVSISGAGASGTLNISGSGAGQYQSSLYNTAVPSYSWNTLNPTNKVQIHGGGIDLDEDADIMIGGRSMKKILDGIEQRLGILVPDPKKLERYEALKQAYEHYKTLEALCNEVPPPEKK